MKDFDYCERCEETLSHPHAFLKIKRPEQNPVMMVTVLNEETEKEKKKHGKGPGRRGGHGVPHGGPRKWFRILKNFVKKKDVKADEIHQMAEEAGFQVPIEFIEKKLEKLRLMSDDENEDKPEEKKNEEAHHHRHHGRRPHCGSHHHGPHGGAHGPMHGGPNMMGNMIKNFMNMAGMKQEDVQNMANASGFPLPKNAFEGMMKGDFSAFKNIDCSKFKNMNCGENKSKGPFGYIKKRAHFVSGTEPENVYLMTPGSTQFVEIEV